jgi:hypothetical protein
VKLLRKCGVVLFLFCVDLSAMRSQIDGCSLRTEHTKEMVKTQIFQFAGIIFQNEEIKSHVARTNGAATALNK